MDSLEKWPLMQSLIKFLWLEWAFAIGHCHWAMAKEVVIWDCNEWVMANGFERGSILRVDYWWSLGWKITPHFHSQKQKIIWRSVILIKHLKIICNCAWDMKGYGHMRAMPTVMDIKIVEFLDIHVITESRYSYEATN